MVTLSEQIRLLISTYKSRIHASFFNTLVNNKNNLTRIRSMKITVTAIVLIINKLGHEIHKTYEEG